MLETYPIVQHTDVTLNTNRTEPFKQSNQTANYAELINTVKFALPAQDDFIPKSPEIYNYFYSEQTEINDTVLYEAQQQDPVIRQLLFWEKNRPPSLHSLSEQIKDFYITIDLSKPKQK